MEHRVGFEPTINEVAARRDRPLRHLRIYCNKTYTLSQWWERRDSNSRLTD